MGHPLTSPFPQESRVRESPSSNIECIPHRPGRSLPSGRSQKGPWEAGTEGTLPPGLLSASQSVLHGAKATLDPVASGPNTSGLEGRGLPWGFPGGTPGTEPACQCRRRKRHGFDPWVGKSS